MQLNQSLPQQFADEMGQLLGPDFPTQICLAVSGGGDSMAMLHLAVGWARVFGVSLRVATVDHGLRAESGEEAALVAEECAGLGLPHDTLKWSSWSGTGNVQHAARQARRDLLAAWMGDCKHLLMAHTQDDQAETVLMRLARGSGVDGLGGMAPLGRLTDEEGSDGFVVRPLLGVTRSALRFYCTSLKIPFVDDPSNENEEFARVRMRKLIGQEGIDIDRIARTADQFRRARIALERRAFEVARSIAVQSGCGDAVLAFDRDGFAQLEDETQLRVLAAALQFIAGSTYKPRLSALTEVLRQILAGGTMTLGGAVFTSGKDTFFVGRELAAAEPRKPVEIGHGIWDAAWRLSARKYKDLEIGALGKDGWSQISTLPEDRPPQIVCLALPSIWRRTTLLACPALEFGPSDVLMHRSRRGKFPELILTH